MLENNNNNNNNNNSKHQVAAGAATPPLPFINLHAAVACRLTSSCSVVLCFDAQECIMSCLRSKKLCPLCRSSINSKDLKAGLVDQQQGQGEQEDWDAAAAAAAGGDGSRVVVCDSKLKVLLRVRG
jgi:hypothetical protein